MVVEPRVAWTPKLPYGVSKELVESKIFEINGLNKDPNENQFGTLEEIKAKLRSERSNKGLQKRMKKIFNDMVFPRVLDVYA